MGCGSFLFCKTSFGDPDCQVTKETFFRCPDGSGVTEGFRGRMQPGKKIDAMETDAETVNAVYAKIRQKNHFVKLMDLQRK